MLDPGLPETERAKLGQEARGQIEAGGTLKAENNWGLRKMAYEIRQRTEADYRWYRFEAPADLLGSLDHNLKIADGVLRFRIFKVDPDVPTIVPPAAGAPSAATPREREPAAIPSAPSGDEEQGEAPADSAE
jgi:small subunit ribosomal protein S6